MGTCKADGDQIVAKLRRLIHEATSGASSSSTTGARWLSFQALFVPILLNRDTGEWDYHAFLHQADADAAATVSHTAPIDWNTVLDRTRS